eukprot:1415011-Alexandrium_andersonii.AAC.1
MLNTQLQDAAQARACAARRARHESGTQGGAWECVRRAASAQTLSTQPKNAGVRRARARRARRMC